MAVVAHVILRGVSRERIQIEPEVTFHPVHEVFMPRPVTITV